MIYFQGDLALYKSTNYIVMNNTTRTNIQILAGFKYLHYLSQKPPSETENETGINRLKA
jgi:hypothetical protein